MKVLLYNTTFLIVRIFNFNYHLKNISLRYFVLFLENEPCTCTVNTYYLLSCTMYISLHLKYMYLYIYIYVIYTCTHQHLHTYTYIYTCIYMSAYSHKHLHPYSYAYLYINTAIPTSTQKYLHFSNIQKQSETEKKVSI